MACDNQVLLYSNGLNREIWGKCGSWFAGTQYFCGDCTLRLKHRYPQGWRYTPGDLCPHGSYVGGCMEDYMCPQCEGS